MKDLVSLVVIGGSLLFGPAICHGQGNLTPLAAPAPTMKTLDQVEPRIPVDGAHTPGGASELYRITQPGSYYLTGDVRGVSGKVGIMILTNHVTLDLSGFGVLGTNGATSGILMSGALTNIVVKNGKVTQWAAMGVYGPYTTNCQYEGLVITQNGAVGLYLGGSCSATRCTITGNASDGINSFSSVQGCLITECIVSGNVGNGISVGKGSTVVRSTANNNGNTGINAGDFSIVMDCTATGNTNNAGIQMAMSAQVKGCTASGNGNNLMGIGIFTGSGALVSDCVVNDNDSGGIWVDVNCLVTKCTAINNGNSTNGSGIVTSSRATVRDCVVMDNHKHGISVGSDSVVMNCHASHNGNGGIGAGITTSGAGSRIEGNQVRDNDTGILATSGDVVIRNSAGGNTTNYSPSSGVNFAPVQGPSTSSNPMANITF